MIQKIITGLVLGLALTFPYSGYASVDSVRLDSALEKLYEKIGDRPVETQVRFLTQLLYKIDTIKQKRSENTQVVKILDYLDDKITLKKDSFVIPEIPVSHESSLILRFGNNVSANSSYILKNKTAISTINNIFIFRYSQNLSSSVMKKISDDIYKMNPDVALFIDQEGGLINRFTSFGVHRLADYLDDEATATLYENLDEATQGKIFVLFSGNYMPPPAKIGKMYNQISPENRENFLKITAYISLKNLADHGIYYHGLVLDLDRGNPVISGLGRSFSSDIDSYKSYIDAYLWASEQSGVTLYGKHFPGHGAGNIDSHSGILSYVNDKTYVVENLEVFEYFLRSSPELKKGIMVGHMYLPEILKLSFEEHIALADFILTDDLAMRGYTDAIGKERAGLFLTTEFLWEQKNIIMVDTRDNVGIR